MRSIRAVTTLFATSEVFPFAKSGGLADVSYSLPRALSSEVDITVVLPLYRTIDQEKYAISKLGIAWDITIAETRHHAELYGCEYLGIEYLFVHSPVLSERDHLYGPPGESYADNALRFGLFSYAIVDLLRRYRFDVLHLNDWQTALSALLVHDDPFLNTKTVFTIHNLAFQGIFDQRMLEQLGISREHFTMDVLEYYGQINFMKAAIAYADRLTTVSPQYAKEILTEKYGNGLEGFLLQHKDKSVGILNGIDSTHFSPEDDQTIERRFSSKTLANKKANKKACLAETALKGIEKPLFVFIGRLAAQKGVDILIDALETMASMPVNILIRGEGETHYRKELEQFSQRYDNIHFFYGYDEAISHRMYASADFLLMPSLFEPCGLNQLIAMRYGAIPVVRETGGLKDSVSPIETFDGTEETGYGFLFVDEDATALNAAVESAVEYYSRKRAFNKVVRHNMRVDPSWDERAKSYLDIYFKLLDKEESNMTIKPIESENQ